MARKIITLNAAKKNVRREEGLVHMPDELCNAKKKYAGCIVIVMGKYEG